MFFILDTADRLGFTQVMAEILPQSPQGRKVKKAILPFLPGDEALYTQMNSRLSAWLSLIRETRVDLELLPLLKELKNIDGVIERLAEGMILDEGELFSIKANLVTTRKIRGVLDSFLTTEGNNFQQRIEQILHDLTLHNNLENTNYDIQNICDSIVYLSQHDLIFDIEPLDELWRLLNPGEVESDRFYLRDEYDPNLLRVRHHRDYLQKQKRELRQVILHDIEQKLGRSIPLSGEIAVSRGDEELLSYMFKRSDIRVERETFSVCYFRWIPDQGIQRLDDELKALDLEEDKITQHVLDILSKKVAEYSTELAQNQKCLGELDWMLAKVCFAQAHDCLPATLSAKNLIQIHGGRHLLVEAEVQSRGSEYTAIDIMVQDGVTVITGSNMGGKTINLRMVGLLTAMAQYGLYVPANQMQFSLREFVYLSVDDDQTKGDLSTFGQEIVGLNQALPLSDKPGLILIDELARGTNPEEGGALGKAIIRYLLNTPTITILTTHFTALTTVPGIKHYKVVGLNQVRYELLKERYHQLTIGTEERSLEIINRLMDYRLMEVGAGEEVTRDAIRVAALLGLDTQIIQDAIQDLKTNA